jgi:protein-S-isoprenylcysteine O-methyltransferase Ste14
MPLYAYAILAVGTIVWCAPFRFVKSRQKGYLTLDRRPRGIGLQCLSYALLWQGPFWTRSLPRWQAALSVLFFVLASLLSWTGARALGRQLRLDAAVDAKHELIRSGPYRFVRHPIYTSMLCVLMATALLITSPVLFIGSVVVFLAGTEIRMNLETPYWHHALESSSRTTG